MTIALAPSALPSAPSSTPRACAAGCGRLLETTDRRVLFCSDPCRRRGRVERRCTECGEPLDAGDGRARRCSTCRGEVAPALSAGPVDLAHLVGREALSPAETAAALGISTVHLYHLWRAGQGPPSLRLGTARRVPVAGLRHWMEEKAAEQAEATDDDGERGR